MTCPTLEQLVGRDGAQHAAGCAKCSAILELAATREPSTLSCGVADALQAARVAGAIAPENELLLLDHLASCDECRQVARELAEPTVSDLLARTSGDDAEHDFIELSPVMSDNYTRGHEIGRGGMGRIVRARDRRLGRLVAIKELLDERMHARFVHEARLTARLQHPAIVSVYEAGCWPDGEPFYAMKYVIGRPLDQVVAGLPTLDQRLTLIPQLTTVMEAIAYAHSEGVVHRDLKPHNVLIGSFGEVVVIDWGLAKDLQGRGETIPFRGGPAVGLTQGGAGTPAYMPPEQARGEEPDERVDVYALGATLHHVLAGDRPDLRRLPDATPRDLRDIVSKAMAKRKEDRYPTAAELAAELRRFQNGQLVKAHRYSAVELARRWLRRRRGLAVMAASFAFVLGLTATLSVRRILAERDRADAQKQRAGQLAEDARMARDGEATRRAAAEELVDFMLMNLRERLEPVGKLDLLGDVGDRVLHYYDGGGAAEDGAARAHRARAFDIVARAAHRRGALARAIAANQQSLKLWEELVREPGRDAGLVYPLSDALALAGDLLKAEGKAHAALASYQRALAIVADGLRSHPTDPALTGKVASLELRIGQIAESTGPPDLALGAYANARERLNTYLVLHPEDDEVRGRLAGAEISLGLYQDSRHEYPASLASLRRALALRLDLLARNPEDSVLRGDIGETQYRLATVLLSVGDETAAAAAFEESRRVRAQLIARDPENVEWQFGLASSLGGQCSLHRQTRRFPEARTACQAAVTVAQALVARTPSLRRSQAILVVAFENLGHVELAADRTAAATTYLRQELVIIDKMRATDPDDPFLERTKAVAQDHLAFALKDQDPAAATAAMAAAVEVARKRLARDPANQQSQLDLTSILLDEADIDLALGRPAGAARAHEEAMAFLPPLVAALPGDAELTELVGRGHLQTGDLAAHRGQRAKASAEWRKAVELLAPLLSSNQLSPELSARIQRLASTAP